jgi:hypothetical protein
VALGNESWRKAKKSLPFPPHPGLYRSLLIGFAKRRYPLWDLRIGEDCSIAYNVVDTVAVAGDETSPALFFRQRYYDPKLSIDALMPLAAHIILTGAHFATYVRELEMVVCKHGEVPTAYRRGCDKLNNLTAASNRLDENIRTALTPTSP